MEAASGRAHSSVANLGPGFDVFGLAVDAFCDTVTVFRGGGGVRVRSEPAGSVPDSAAGNTAGLVARAASKKFGLGGMRVLVSKGVPAGFGMGSSAASAAAAAVAIDKLFDLKLGGEELVRLAGEGERASAGAVHYDNVAASVLGGFAVVRARPFGVVSARPPRMKVCIVTPDVPVPPEKTRVSRGLVPSSVPTADATANLANACVMTAGFLRRDLAMIAGSVSDAIAEPARASSIPGFAAARRAAKRAGALAFSISGAGPSVFAFCKDGAGAEKCGAAVRRAFASAGVESEARACSPAGGASAGRAVGSW